MITADTIRQALQCDNPSCACHKPDGHVHCPAHADIKTPNLSVSQDNGKPLVKCFAGCEQDRVISALKARDLWDSGNGGGALGLTLPEFAKAKKLDPAFLTKHGVFQATGKSGPYLVFVHRDHEGREVKEAVRFRFSMDERPKSKRGGKPMLYGLGRLSEFQSGGELVIDEGESDTLTFWSYGVAAVGMPGKGLLKTINPAHFAAFDTIYVWQEPDAPELPGQVAARLPGMNIKALVPPAGIKDISDAPVQGLDVPALIADLKARALPPDTTPNTITNGFSLSDLGNARRLVAQHGQDLHYCHLSKKWLIWNGKFWAVDATGEVIRRAKLTVAQIYQEAAAAGEKQREAIAKFALRSEHDQRIRGMIRLAESEPGIPISPGQMDADPWLLNCLNGTVNLKTGKLRPHDRRDLITRLAPIKFDPAATCPRLEGFLDHIQESNANVISFIQRILGYALTGDCREQCLFLLWGSGANGKSTLLAIISAILGNYAMQTPTETLLAKQKGDIPNDIARLNGPRFVTALEVSQGRRLAESLIKQLTGQDTISARFLFGEYFDFKPQFKLFLGTNHKPVVKDTSHAMWRRLKLIPFPVQIPEAEQDKGLPDALLAEAPGILAWMVRGCLSWQHGGLSVPDEVRAATGDYQAEQDVLGDFFSECCIMAPGASATAAELYQAYGEWAENSGEKRPLSQRAFGMSLTERGFERTRGTGGKWFWRGIGLKGILKEVTEVTEVTLNPTSYNQNLF